jgi:hypothetical protein
MSPNSKLKAILDQSEADTMKPVDDFAVLSDTDKVGVPPPQVYHPLKLSNAPVPFKSLELERKFIGHLGDEIFRIREHTVEMVQ